MVLAFNKVPIDAKGKFEIGIKESGGITDLITLKVYEFPMINILWIGILITVLGFGMAVVQRVKLRNVFHFWFKIFIGFLFKTYIVSL